MWATLLSSRKRKKRPKTEGEEGEGKGVFSHFQSPETVKRKGRGKKGKGKKRGTKKHCLLDPIRYSDRTKRAQITCVRPGIKRQRGRGKKKKREKKKKKRRDERVPGEHFHSLPIKLSWIT